MSSIVNAFSGSMACLLVQTGNYINQYSGEFWFGCPGNLLATILPQHYHFILIGVEAKLFTDQVGDNHVQLFPV